MHIIAMTLDHCRSFSASKRVGEVVFRFRCALTQSLRNTIASDDFKRRDRCAVRQWHRVRDIEWLFVRVCVVLFKSCDCAIADDTRGDDDLREWKRFRDWLAASLLLCAWDAEKFTECAYRIGTWDRRVDGCCEAGEWARERCGHHFPPWGVD